VTVNRTKREAPAPEPPKRQRKIKIDINAVSSREGEIEVHRTMYGAERQRLEKVLVPKFTGPVGLVEVGGSVTRNLGDFNFVRVEVKVSVPCYPEGSEIDRAKLFAADKVDKFIQEELATALAASGGQ
jgi:hypothetical protein